MQAFEIGLINGLGGALYAEHRYQSIYPCSPVHRYVWLTPLRFEVAFEHAARALILFTKVLRAMKAHLLCVVVGVMLSGCGTVNTVLSSDASASSNLRKAQTRCESIPRVYSGIAYDLCLLHGPPQTVERNPAAPALIPIQLLDFIPSGILDTVLLPYTIYLQSAEGSLDI